MGGRPPLALGKTRNQLISDKPVPHATAGDNSPQGTGHDRGKTGALLTFAEGGLPPTPGPMIFQTGSPPLSPIEGGGEPPSISMTIGAPGDILSYHTSSLSETSPTGPNPDAQYQPHFAKPQPDFPLFFVFHAGDDQAGKAMFGKRFSGGIDQPYRKMKRRPVLRVGQEGDHPLPPLIRI